MKEDKEEIGLLLWQEEKEPVMQRVMEYIGGHANLEIVGTLDLDFVDKTHRSAFVRGVYEGENIPDENPKIVSDARISFIVLNDYSPKYQWATTGSGKRVYLNTNSANLKKYARELYHWKYLHSTDDHQEFLQICGLCREAEASGNLKIYREGDLEGE